MATAFAPAERASRAEGLRRHARLTAPSFVPEFLDAIPDMSAVLNEHRRIVFANRAYITFLQLVRGDSRLADAMLGRRHGEAAACIRAALTEGGCGTTPYCRTGGATVSLGCHAEGDAVCFSVHNAGVMPVRVQSQVFNRSFSTKGSGRGLGTYRIKLISERYLRGQVSCVPNADEGTRFTACYPVASVPCPDPGKEEGRHQPEEAGSRFRQ